MNQIKREPDRNPLSLASFGERDSHFQMNYILEKIINNKENLIYSFCSFKVKGKKVISELAAVTPLVMKTSGIKYLICPSYCSSSEKCFLFMSAEKTTKLFK